MNAWDSKPTKIVNYPQCKVGELNLGSQTARHQTYAQGHGIFPLLSPDLLSPVSLLK